MNPLQPFLSLFTRTPEIIPEVRAVHYNHLPDTISVEWQRDGEYIVGIIKTENKEFMTQGKGADDFVEMVHDAVYTMYDVPELYRSVMKAYTPPEEFRQALSNTSRERGSSLVLAKA
jgi:hypothetical protein